MSTAVYWPSAVDYQTALQVSQISFRDNALKQGTVAKDAVGMPLAATGNVVVVFRMQLPQGDIAIRCFTRRGQYDEMHQRYQALHRHLQSHKVPAFVACSFRPNEIMVNGSWYPIVLMEWVPGVQLHNYIERRIYQPVALLDLAKQWRILMAELRAAHVAHGDLSDGNVLVDVRGQLRLLDYDAAYVPALSGHPPLELGKPNYQHPERLREESPSYGYYAEDVDSFASLVIFLSLRALAADPSLWMAYHTGENLIFERADFEAPNETPIWNELYGSTDPDVHVLTEILAEWCERDVADLPDLEDVLRECHLRRTRAKQQENARNPLEQKDGTLPDKPIDKRVDRKAKKNRKATWNRPVVAVLSLVIVLLAILAIVRPPLSSFSTEPEVIPVQEAPPVLTTISPEVLAGYYTGFATQESGEREAIVLTIGVPTVSPDDDTMRFTYSLNSSHFQQDGIGSYAVNRGEVTLDDKYQLYLTSGNGKEVVLASRKGDNPSGAISVKRIMVP